MKLLEASVIRGLKDGITFAVAGALALNATANGVGRLGPEQSAVIDAALRSFLLQAEYIPLLWPVWCPDQQNYLEGKAHIVGLLRVHPTIAGAFVSSPAMQLFSSQRRCQPLIPGKDLAPENLVVAGAARELEVGGCLDVPVVDDAYVAANSLVDGLPGDAAFEVEISAALVNAVMAVAVPLIERGAAVVAPCANAQCADVIAIQMASLPESNRRYDVPQEENGKLLGRVAFISAKMGKPPLKPQLATLGFSETEKVKCQLTPALIVMAMHVATKEDDPTEAKNIVDATDEVRKLVAHVIRKMKPVRVKGLSPDERRRVALAAAVVAVASETLRNSPPVDVYLRFVTDRSVHPQDSGIKSWTNPFQWATVKTKNPRYQTFDFPGLNDLYCHSMKR